MRLGQDDNRSCHPRPMMFEVSIAEAISFHIACRLIPTSLAGEFAEWREQQCEIGQPDF